MSDGGRGRRVIISYRQEPRVKISTWRRDTTRCADGGRVTIKMEEEEGNNNMETTRWRERAGDHKMKEQDNRR